MKKLFLLISLMIFGFAASSQTGSPLKMISFHKLSNEIADLKELKDRIGRDCDYDNNKAALIRVKAQGFAEKTMNDFSIYAKPGIQIIDRTNKNGELWWYVSSNCQGTIVIKYMGEREINLPGKLDAKGVYELVLGVETATLLINAVPQTAVIYVDGNKIGTGYGSAAISVGSEHRYKVTCTDYIPEEDVVRTDKAEKIERQIELRPNFGYITIKSDPSGAEVYVDDMKVGVTPYLMKRITLGRHAVEVRKYGYESQADMVMIKVDEVNKQFENVKLVEDKSVPQQPVTTTPVISNFNNYTNTGVSSDVFSVSANKKVHFSKGNLQYQASTNTWRFAEHQWDKIGDANQNVSASYDGWIDLFGWGTGNNPTNCSTNSMDYGSFADWGDNIISNGGDKNWFTLTKDEWVYVFSNRSTGSGIRYAKAMVNDVNGVILLPDNWNSSNYYLNNTNDGDASFSSNRISQSDWTDKLENNGAVFLPVAGYRLEVPVYGIDIYGSYWSSVSYDNYISYAVHIYDIGLSYDGKSYRWSGLSVRLVCDAEE